MCFVILVTAFALEWRKKHLELIHQGRTQNASDSLLRLVFSHLKMILLNYTCFFPLPLVPIFLQEHNL